MPDDTTTSDAMSDRELDAKVAVAVFGWRWMRDRKRNLAALVPPEGDAMWRIWNYHADLFEPCDPAHERFSDWDNIGGYAAHYGDGMRAGPWAFSMPSFSSDIAAAWLVVEAITSPPRTEADAKRAANTRFAFWWNRDNLWAESAPSAARRICLAALEAIGVPHAR